MKEKIIIKPAKIKELAQYLGKAESTVVKYPKEKKLLMRLGLAALKYNMSLK